MERLMKGDIVVLPFPFSDLTTTKKRPACILANINGDDRIVCQITTIKRTDNKSISLFNSDLKNGVLKIESYLRINKIFTIDKSLILYKFGEIKKEKMNVVIHKVCNLFKA